MPQTIHLYELTLTLDTPGGVTAPESRRSDAATAAALPLARDTEGRPHVPATSLAGSLRDHAARTLGADGDAERLFGTAGDGKEDDRSTATASAVRILGTRTTLPEHAPTPLHRMSTAIDRVRGAALTETLRERELLPPGTTVTAWLRVDRADAAEELERLLPSWSPRIGGARSTGHGRARLTRVTRRVLDLSTPQGRRVWLTRGGPALFDDASVILSEAESAPAQLPFVFGKPIDFEVVDALHVGSGEHERGGHRATDRARHLRDHLGRPVVPGSTWKGLLRSRCEFILRSLSEDASCAETPGCGVCPVCAAFGYSADASDMHSGGLRGRLVFLDSPVTQPGGTPAETVSRNHVALDRFTGGATTGLLFTDEVVEQGRVTLTILDEPSDPDASPLDTLLRDVLLLALYDLHTGVLGIGAGTTRGYGTLRGTSETTAFLEAEAPLARQRLGDALPISAQEDGQ
ncbi:DNA repair protein [Streptomyces sp. 8K308]|uniref:RAMP superfamily CRISPR-associated protein n=1 Tax=Streptomyces sp. 8K308 TaxID=2530388 RepID=UPI001045C5C6|nr:RAMP superfamily CRISPR-associated protein [Streptomyces sp. 8K308]TDC19421.1 DNA repair protein [Streptomyces sp. 8K308]